MSFENVKELFEYILDGCETVEEAKEKIKIFSEVHFENIKNNDAEEYAKNQREKARIRVQRYRERQRDKVFDKHLKCAYCGSDASEIDHLIPISKGGTNEPENLVPACKKCNGSKNDKDLADFLNMSINDHYLNVDHQLVQSNKKIMNIVEFKNGEYSKK